MSGTTTAPATTNRLRGDMGTTSVVFMTLACMSPLTAVAGYLTLVIAWGNGLGAPAMYLTVGVVMSLFALGYVAMVRDVARPGGLYAYVTAGLGKRVGLGAGFVAMVTYLVAQVGLSIFGGISLSYVISGQFGGPEIGWYWCALPFVLLATIGSYFNIGLSAKMLGVMLIIEVVFVLGFDLFTLLRAGAANFEGAGASFTWEQLTAGSFGLAFLFALSQFSGFESPSLYWEEMKDPARTVARATFIIIGCIAAMYSLTAWSFVVGFGPQDAVAAIGADSSGAFRTLFAKYLSGGLYNVANVFIITGILASVLAGNNILSRYLFNCGVDGVLPKAFGQANPQTGAPSFAAITVGVTLTGVLTVTVVSGGDPNELLALVSGAGTYGFLVLFLLGSLAIIAYFARTSSMSPWARGGLIITALISGAAFLAVLVYVTRNLSVLVGDNGAFGVALQAIVWTSFVAGLVYSSWLLARRPDVFATIGREDLADPV